MRATREITKPVREVLEIKVKDGVEEKIPLESVESLVISIKQLDCGQCERLVVRELVIKVEGDYRKFSWAYQLTDPFEIKEGDKVRGFYKKYRKENDDIDYERIYLREIERYNGNREFLNGRIAIGFEAVE